MPEESDNLNNVTNLNDATGLEKLSDTDCLAGNEEIDMQNVNYLVDRDATMPVIMEESQDMDTTLDKDETMIRKDTKSSNLDKT